MNISPIIARLDPLIRRLGSNHDGEVVNCVRIIEQQLDKAGATWHDLADCLTTNAQIGAEDHSPPIFYNYFDAVDWLLANYRGQLSPRDLDFCENMHQRLPHRLPSPKQAKWLQGLVEKGGGRFYG